MLCASPTSAVVTAMLRRGGRKGEPNHRRPGPSGRRPLRPGRAGAHTMRKVHLMTLISCGSVALNAMAGAFLSYAPVAIVGGPWLTPRRLSARALRLVDQLLTGARAGLRRGPAASAAGHSGARCMRAAGGSARLWEAHEAWLRWHSEHTTRVSPQQSPLPSAFSSPRTSSPEGLQHLAQLALRARPPAQGAHGGAGSGLRLAGPAADAAADGRRPPAKQRADAGSAGEATHCFSLAASTNSSARSPLVVQQLRV